VTSLPFAGAALALLLAACGVSGGDSAGDAGGGFPAGVPGGARAVADVAGARLGLSAQVWLDRMPAPVRPAGPAARVPAPGPLHVAVQVVAADGFPDGVAIDRVWVTAGERTWESPLAYLVKAEGRLEGGAAGGPSLAEGLPATVVVRVTAPDGVRFLEARVPQVAAAY
jgi:hypothetical protein